MPETSLYNGDCYELIPRLPDTSIDLVVTDPPYRIIMSGVKKTRNSIKSNSDVLVS